MRSKLWLIVTLLILAFLFGSCAGNVVEGPRGLTDTEQEAVVMVKAESKGGGLGRHSGFIISPDGYIFTFLLNWDELEKVEVVLLDGRSFDASVAAIDTLNDAARIKIEANNLSTLGLPDEDVALEAGDEVVIAGYVEGRFTTTPAKVLEPDSTLPLPWTNLPAIKLNAGGEPGMMGGPVMDAAGHLVGAMLAIDPKIGESFMVPVDGIMSMFFPTPQKTPPPSATTSETSLISREQAIELATDMLPESVAAVVARGDVRAELHGWYWEVTFDNINAEAEELMPFPLRSPPPGGSASRAYPGIYQSVVLTVDAETGDPLSAGASKEPKPGPYVSREQAISSARERITSGISEIWLERAMVEAYLRGDIWIVLFWEEGASIEDRSSGLSVNRFRVSVDAVTGEAEGLRRG